MSAGNPVVAYGAASLTLGGLLLVVACFRSLGAIFNPDPRPSVTAFLVGTGLCIVPVGVYLLVLGGAS